MHSTQATPTKGKPSQPKSDQHQLAPINQPQDQPKQGNLNIMGGNEDMAVDATELHGAVVKEEILKTGLITKTEELAMASPNETFSILKEEVRIIHIEADEISGMEMIPITGTGIKEIEIPITKVILIGAEDGIITEVKDIVIMGEGEDGTQISNIMILGTNNTHNLKTPITITHPRWDSNTATQSHRNNIPIPNNNNNIRHNGPQPHHARLQIFVNCVKIKAIMTINVNLQVILWPECIRPLIKAVLTITKTKVKASGKTVRMIKMTLMGNLFSSGGSRCH